MNLSPEQISLNLVQWFEDAMKLLMEGNEGDVFGIHVRHYQENGTWKIVLCAVNNGNSENFEFLSLLTCEMLKCDTESTWQVFLREHGFACVSIMHIGGHVFRTETQPPLLYSTLPTLVP